MLKTVNLEEGMPLVDAAIRRATFELKSGRRMGLTAIKFIHGYGSSGNGGRIRVELQKYLTRLQNKREIRLFVPGSGLKFSTRTRKSCCRPAVSCQGTRI